MKVIFLDIDGVIKPFPDILKSLEFNKNCVKYLNKIISETGAKIVISSSWKNYENENIYGMLQGKTLERIFNDNAIVGEIIDRTKNESISGCRTRDIAYWLKDNQVDEYIVLDDCPSLFSYNSEYLDKSKILFTISNIGITNEIMNIAIRMLNEN